MSSEQVTGNVMTKYNEPGDEFVGKDELRQPDDYILAPFTVEWMGSELTLNDALGRFWELSHRDDREHYVRVNVHELKYLYKHWAETFKELDAIDGKPRRSTDVVDSALAYVAARMKYLEGFLGSVNAELIRLEVERSDEPVPFWC